MATLPSLQVLNVKMNQLAALPDEWVHGYPGAANSNLTFVSICWNRASGSFPAALALAPSLDTLYINNNKLR